MKPKYAIACNIWKGSLVHITYITNIQEDGRVLRYPFIEKKKGVTPWRVHGLMVIWNSRRRPQKIYRSRYSRTDQIKFVEDSI